MTMLIPSLQRVITNTIRGAFIADAASMGTHWIYNPKDVLEKIRSVEQPEFLDPPSPNYYSSTEFPNHYLKGMLSPYGEQLLFVTQYTAQHTDTELTGPDMSTAMFDWAISFGGRPDHATSTFINNIKAEKMYPECGADDDQAHIYMKIVPVTCRYIDNSSSSNTSSTTLLIQKVAEIIRVHQNNDTAVAFGVVAARILEAVILSSTKASLTPALLLQALDTCYDTVRSDLEMILGTEQSELIEVVLTAYQRAKTAASEYATLDELLLQLSHEKMKDQPENSFYDLAARSCALPGSFIGPVYQLYKVAMSSSSDAVIEESVYIDAIRENILAAGDTCSRGVFVGAVLAAAIAVPEDTATSAFEAFWEQVEMNTRTEVQLYADQIAAPKLVTSAKDEL